jgi:Ca2+/Na+ antiporter
MDVGTVIHVTGGFVRLMIRAEVPVRHAVRMADVLGLSPLVVGLTLVACGKEEVE